jgi:import inner membrane translocase subunit TIM22
MYWCQKFAFITGEYCGKQDVWNTVISGCVTGAGMQVKEGTQTSTIKCGRFAAFSLVIDLVMGMRS